MKRTHASIPILLLALGLAAGCGPQSPADTTAGDVPAVPPPANSPESGTAAAPSGKAPAPPADGKPVHVVIATSEGTIRLDLYPDKAPATVANFVSYAKKGHYDGTIFHRVISDFMIQGGGFTPDAREKDTDPPIPLESQNGLHNQRGWIAMARTSVPDSATSQFFINVVDNTDKLDHPNPDGHGYAVFGKVTSGMDVADRIRAVPTHEKMTPQGPMPDWPRRDVVIKSVKVVE